MQRIILKYLLTGFCALFCALASTALGQSLISSSISGIVSSGGKPLAGAAVTAFYEPTNTKVTTTTNASGRFLFDGLRVGGPYTVSVAAGGFQPQEQKGIQLELSQVYQTDFDFKAPQPSDVVVMQAFVTTADSNTLFDSLTTGSGSQVNQQQIETFPTIARTMNEFARLDPRVVITDRTNGETSAGGQNHRYNSMLIDGVKSNDVFGLTSNGLPAQGNPISIDVIQSFDVQVAPYDVRQSGFTGAAINSVTKSGGNDFHGTLKYLWTNQNLRAKNEDPTNVNYGKRETFRESTLSATLGGPILKNRLFFFAGYEKFKRIEPPPSPGFGPTDAAVQLIRDTFKAYNYDVGSFSNAGSLKKYDSKLFGKLDWNISDGQRLSYRYNKADGHQPIFQDYTTSNATSFGGHWYTNHTLNESHVVSLFSNWTPDFKTEVRASRSKYKSDRDPNGPDFPQVVITQVPSSTTGTGTIFVGTENSTANNHLKVDDYNATLDATYLWNDHTLEAGIDFEKDNFFDIFLQSLDGAYGTSSATGGYTYAQLGGAAGLTGQPINYAYQFNPGGITVANAYTINNFNRMAVYAQDRWSVNPKLTLTGGVRLDRYATPIPGYNAAASAFAGINNTNSIDGLTTVSPRFGFNWALDSDKKTQIRGGAGIFLGQGPGVWLANNYFNNGLSSRTATKATLAAQGITDIPFQPDVTKQLKGNTSTTTINMLANNFKLPTVLKANLAVDRKLPGVGLVATLEFNETKTLEATWYQDLNLKQIGTTPDGRILYGGAANRNSASFVNVFLMKNTKKGEAQQGTVKLQKPWKNHWFASISYTYGTSQDVSPVTSSTAGSNFGGRIVYNNDDTVGRSNYEVRHRVLATLEKDFYFVKNYRTVASLVFETRSGRPFSYVFSNDANGDAANQSNDLFYVPTGPSDPKVVFTTQAQSDNFFAWLAGNKDLNRFAGQVVPRNSGTSRFIHQADLHIQQEIPIWGNVKGELFYDILNFGNLLNSHWGRYSAVNFPYNYFVASGVANTTTNQYTYTYTSTPRGQTMGTDLSRWQMQGGVQVKF